MFDIAWSELLLIAVLALIFIGPKELPHVMKSLGKLMSKLRQSADEFRRQFEDSIRDTGYEDINKKIQDLRQLHPANQLRASIDRALNPSEPVRSGPMLYSEANPDEISPYAKIPGEATEASSGTQIASDGSGNAQLTGQEALASIMTQEVLPNTSIAAPDANSSAESQASNAGASSAQDKESERTAQVA